MKWTSLLNAPSLFPLVKYIFHFSITFLSLSLSQFFFLFRSVHLSVARGVPDVHLVAGHYMTASFLMSPLAASGHPFLSYSPIFPFLLLYSSTLSQLIKSRPSSNPQSLRSFITSFFISLFVSHSYCVEMKQRGWSS